MVALVRKAFINSSHMSALKVHTVAQIYGKQRLNINILYKNTGEREQQNQWFFITNFTDSIVRSQGHVKDGSVGNSVILYVHAITITAKGSCDMKFFWV